MVCSLKQRLCSGDLPLRAPPGGAFKGEDRHAVFLTLKKDDDLNVQNDRWVSK